MFRNSQPSSHFETLVLAVCITLSVVLLALPDSVQIMVADRLGAVITAPYWSVRNFGEDIFRVRQENARLQARIVQLELLEATAGLSRHDSVRLARHGDPTSPYRGEMVPCEVLARESGRFVTKIKIKSLEPVIWRPHQPVISPLGYLGSIVQVIDGQHAWVELLTAPGVALGVEIERTGLLGVLRPRAGKFLLEMIGRDEDVVPGDRIVTSGIAEIRDERTGRPPEGLVPRGLPVGVVEAVASPTDKIFKEIHVRVLTSFKYNDAVFVVQTSVTSGATGPEVDR